MVQGWEEVWKVSLLRANLVPANAAASLSVYIASLTTVCYEHLQINLNIPLLLSSSTPIQPAKIHLSLPASRNTLPPHSPEEASNPQWTRHTLHLQTTPKKGRKNSPSLLYRLLLTQSTFHRSHALCHRPSFFFASTDNGFLSGIVKAQVNIMTRVRSLQTGVSGACAGMRATARCAVTIFSE